MHNKVLYILMVLAMIAWGETWVSAKILDRYLDANELIFWRFFFTTLGLLPVLFYYKLSLKISKRNLLIALISAALLAFYNYAFFLGTKYGLASFGGVLVTTLNPIITFVFISILARKSFNLQESMGLILGVIGAMIMLQIWNYNTGSILSQGNIYYLIASFIWPFLTITSSYQKNIPSLVFIFYMFSLTSFIDFILIGGNTTNIVKFDYIFWVNLLLLSLYGTTFATTIYFIAVTKLGSKAASSFFFLVPSSAIVFAALFLGEKVELPLIIGGALAVVAVYILNYVKQKRSKF